MTTDIDQRHRNVVAQAYRSAQLARQGAVAGLLIGVAAIFWTIGAISIDEIDVAEGILAIAGVVLGTVVTSVGLYAASYRTSVGASALERRLGDG